MKKTLAFIAGSTMVLSLVAIGAHTASAQAVPGCLPGYAFSTVTGAACTTATVDAGCTTGNAFSTQTGARCTNNGTTVTGTTGGTVTQGTTMPSTPGLPNTGAQPAASAMTIMVLALTLAAGSFVALKKIRA
jgi:LPXTG-motif cell wall-anchored protein